MSLININKPPHHEHAIAWLIMKGDSYTPGVFASVYSCLGVKADLVIMTTPDVSNEAKATFKLLPVIIAEVPYISFPTLRFLSNKVQKRYETWISESYTKWNILALPYKKVFFLDADTIATSKWQTIVPKLDDLFTLPTPAGVFNNPYVKPIGTMKNFMPKEPRGKDGYLLHGEVIPRKNIDNMLDNDTMVP